MPKFPGEGGCVEMFEHRHYFGNLLWVFEVTAMTAVNMKVDRKEDCKDSPGVMYIENISSRTLFRTVVF